MLIRTFPWRNVIRPSWITVDATNTMGEDASRDWVLLTQPIKDEAGRRSRRTSSTFCKDGRIQRQQPSMLAHWHRSGSHLALPTNTVDGRVTMTADILAATGIRTQLAHKDHRRIVIITITTVYNFLCAHKMHIMKISLPHPWNSSEYFQPVIPHSIRQIYVWW